MNRRRILLLCSLPVALVAVTHAAEPIGAPPASAAGVAPRVVMVGTHKVAGTRNPVALVELWVHGYAGTLDLGKFQQDVPRLGPARSQVPWLEHELNAKGTSGRELSFEPLSVDGSVRLAFFLHYPQFGQPLRTPFGTVVLPRPTPLPKRLSFIKYEPPD